LEGDREDTMTKYDKRCEEHATAAFEALNKIDALAQRDTARLMLAAADNLLVQIDHMTTEEFERGAERKEREALRAAIVAGRAAGIKDDWAPETRHARDCLYVTSDGPAPCTCGAIAAAEAAGIRDG
jgi:hypothetical protein